MQMCNVWRQLRLSGLLYGSLLIIAARLLLLVMATANYHSRHAVLLPLPQHHHGHHNHGHHQSNGPNYPHQPSPTHRRSQIQTAGDLGDAKPSGWLGMAEGMEGMARSGGGGEGGASRRRRTTRTVEGLARGGTHAGLEVDAVMASTTVPHGYEGGRHTGRWRGGESGGGEPGAVTVLLAGDNGGAGDGKSALSTSRLTSSGDGNSGGSLARLAPGAPAGSFAAVHPSSATTGASSGPGGVGAGGLSMRTKQKRDGGGGTNGCAVSGSTAGHETLLRGEVAAGGSFPIGGGGAVDGSASLDNFPVPTSSRMGPTLGAGSVVVEMGALGGGGPVAGAGDCSGEAADEVGSRTAVGSRAVARKGSWLFGF